jgi:hypothetical protein
MIRMVMIIPRTSIERSIPKIRAVFELGLMGEVEFKSSPPNGVGTFVVVTAGAGVGVAAAAPMTAVPVAGGTDGWIAWAVGGADTGTGSTSDRVVVMA